MCVCFCCWKIEFDPAKKGESLNGPSFFKGTSRCYLASILRFGSWISSLNFLSFKQFSPEL